MMLHPFFSYFGSKYRLAKCYPQPQCDEIVEPFAGSAGYALLYPEKQVTLYEIYLGGSRKPICFSGWDECDPLGNIIKLCC